MARYTPGEKHPKAKLTEANVLEIRRRWAQGDRQVRMAAEYGVNQSQISRIVNGEHWSHLPEEE